MNRLAVFCGILLGVAIMIGAVSCEKDPVTEPGGSDDLSLLVSMVSEVEGAEGDVVTLKFYSGKGPKKGDMVILKGASSEFRCDIVSLKSDSFGFKIPVGMKSGRYNFYIARGDQSKMLGEIEFTIEKRVVIAEKEGYNVYGLISCGGVGVEGVVVSDGIETTVTDKDGLYYLKSDEYNKFVFMSIPSGYEAAANGVIPKFHKLLDGDSNTTERADWTLTKVDNANHVMYILAICTLPTGPRTCLSSLISHMILMSRSKRTLRRNSMPLLWETCLGTFIGTRTNLTCIHIQLL